LRCAPGTEVEQEIGQQHGAVQQPDRLDQHGKPLLRSALDYRQVLLEIM
jgi:hypothetical protein